jgi:antitoxin ParD1/3/4
MATILIDLDDHSRKFLNQLLTTGRYKSENDALLAGLSLLEEELQALRQALIEGEKSGESERSLDKIIAEAKAAFDQR